jgi:hypothetical protein
MCFLFHFRAWTVVACRLVGRSCMYLYECLGYKILFSSPVSHPLLKNAPRQRHNSLCISFRSNAVQGNSRPGFATAASVFLYLFWISLPTHRTHHNPFSLASSFFFSFAAFSLLWITPSAPIPPKTSPTPIHCFPPSLCPNQTTDKIMVSILRVTVIVTRSRDEKVDSV